MGHKAPPAVRGRSQPTALLWRASAWPAQNPQWARFECRPSERDLLTEKLPSDDARTNCNPPGLKLGCCRVASRVRLPIDWSQRHSGRGDGTGIGENDGRRAVLRVAFGAHGPAGDRGVDGLDEFAMTASSSIRVKPCRLWRAAADSTAGAPFSLFMIQLRGLSCAVPSFVPLLLPRSRRWPCAPMGPKSATIEAPMGRAPEIIPEWRLSRSTTYGVLALETVSPGRRQPASRR